MKKRLISLLLAIVMVCSIMPSAFAASDKATQAADALYELGLFKGTGTNADGTPIYDLDKTPTRNQAIIMLVRLLGKEEEALAGTWSIPFTDVTDNMKPYIGYAYTNGLTNGYAATTYCGTNPIKANQYITFVLRALGYTSGEDFAVSTAWDFSDEIGLTSGDYSAATKSFTRGDVAEISYAALELQQKGNLETLAEKLIAESVFTQAQYKSSIPDQIKNHNVLKARCLYARINGSLYSIEYSDDEDLQQWTEIYFEKEAHSIKNKCHKN